MTIRALATLALLTILPPSLAAGREKEDCKTIAQIVGGEDDLSTLGAAVEKAGLKARRSATCRFVCPMSDVAHAHVIQLFRRPWTIPRRT